MTLLPVLVLASGSPRRRVLLDQLGVPFEVRPAAVDETPLPGEGAYSLVRRLAVHKAEAVLALAPERELVVLGADTVVSVDGQVLGKPIDDADATRMLRRLSGSRHQVFTGIAVASRTALPSAPGSAGGPGSAATLQVEVCVTQVHMRVWTDDEIASYVASGEPRDKAGSYAIQETGDRYVDAIEGSFDNVVGLDVEVARLLLVEAGVVLPA